MEKTLLISAADRTAICEAASILTAIFQGHGYEDAEVRNAAMALLAIRFEGVSQRVAS